MRHYDKDFKLNTVNLCKTSGRSKNKIAQELGVPKSTVCKWVKEYHQEGSESFRGKGYIKSSEEELKALRKELHHVRQERDILKKAVAIFSEPRGKGTSL
jgi:transposase